MDEPVKVWCATRAAPSGNSGYIWPKRAAGRAHPCPCCPPNRIIANYNVGIFSVFSWAQTEPFHSRLFILPSTSPITWSPTISHMKNLEIQHFQDLPADFIDATNSPEKPRNIGSNYDDRSLASVRYPTQCITSYRASFTYSTAGQWSPGGNVGHIKVIEGRVHLILTLLSTNIISSS